MNKTNKQKLISERILADMARWEADKCRKHFSYSLKGKAET